MDFFYHLIKLKTFFSFEFVSQQCLLSITTVDLLQLTKGTSEKNNDLVDVVAEEKSSHNPFQIKIYRQDYIYQ